MHKVALVSGGAQGIGEGVARLLAARGWHLAVADLRKSPEFKLALKEWNRRIGVNLSGAFLMTKHAAPHLRRARRDRQHCLDAGAAVGAR